MDTCEEFVFPYADCSLDERLSYNSEDTLLLDDPCIPFIWDPVGRGHYRLIIHCMRAQTVDAIIRSMQETLPYLRYELDEIQFCNIDSFTEFTRLLNGIYRITKRTSLFFENCLKVDQNCPLLELIAEKYGPLSERIVQLKFFGCQMTDVGCLNLLEALNTLDEKDHLKHVWLDVRDVCYFQTKLQERMLKLCSIRAVDFNEPLYRDPYWLITCSKLEHHPKSKVLRKISTEVVPYRKSGSLVEKKTSGVSFCERTLVTKPSFVCHIVGDTTWIGGITLDENSMAMSSLNAFHYQVESLRYSTLLTW